MRDEALRWWRGRTLREQRMLLVMGALLALVLAWLVVIRPLDDALAHARARHARAVVALGLARGQAAAIGALEQGRAPAPATDVTGTITRAANDAGFDARVTAEGASQAAVAIEAVRAPAFFGWVSRLEATGLIVDHLSARANSDATLSVRASFRGRR